MYQPLKFDLDFAVPAPAAGRPDGEDQPRHADTLGVRPILKLTHPAMVMLAPHAWSDQALRLALGLSHLTQRFMDATRRES